MPVKLTDFADPAIREGWIRDKGMMVFQMYSDRTRMSIDIFVRYPLDFDELWDQGTKIDLPGTSLRIASIDHLILMKRGASRPQDLARNPRLRWAAARLRRPYFPRYGAIITGNPGRTHGILHMVDNWLLHGHLFL